MHDEHPHPLLAQVPLTLSPFLALPTAVPLPYSYKTLPSTLPPSILQSSPSHSSSSSSNNNNNSTTTTTTSQPPPPPAYITSPRSTAAATPDQILASCTTLQHHLAALEADARRVLAEWEDRRRREELAEQRRVAPGWLDSGVHILKPEGVEEEEGGGPAGADAGAGARVDGMPQLMDLDPQAERNRQEGEELDKVFGGLQV